MQKFKELFPIQSDMNVSETFFGDIETNHHMLYAYQHINGKKWHTV